MPLQAAPAVTFAVSSCADSYITQLKVESQVLLTIALLGIYLAESFEVNVTHCSAPLNLGGMFFKEVSQISVDL